MGPARGHGHDRLADFAEILEAAGAAVESTLVFTNEWQTTIDRRADEGVSPDAIEGARGGDAGEMIVEVAKPRESRE